MTLHLGLPQPAPAQMIPGARQRLPDRRRSVNTTIIWSGKVWSVTVGFDDAARVREIFADGPKAGSEMEALLDDACIALSLLLQAGHTAHSLVRRFQREAIDPLAPAASILGLAAEIAAREERDVFA